MSLVNGQLGNFPTISRGYYGGRDLAIWHRGKLVAISRHRDGNDFVTIVSEEE